MFRLLFSHSVRDRSKYQELPTVDHREAAASLPSKLLRADTEVDHVSVEKPLQPSPYLRQPSSSSFRFIALFFNCIAATAVLAAAAQLLLHARLPTGTGTSSDSTSTVPPVATAVAHHGTLPTLLNVLNANATFLSATDFAASPSSPPLYVYALDNPLYDRLQRAIVLDSHPQQWLDGDAEIMERPTISTTHSSFISFYKPLVVSWTMGRKRLPLDESRRSRHVVQPLQEILPVVTNETIIVFRCGDESDDRDSSQDSIQQQQHSTTTILDAATVQQALETSRYHLGQAPLHVLVRFNIQKGDDGVSSWFIPRFPTVRYQHCHFELLQPVVGANRGAEEETTTTLVRITASPRITIQSLNTPMSIHLALTQDPSEMVVDFSTGTGRNCQDTVPVVEYSLSATVPSAAVSSPPVWTRHGTTDTYTANDMCQGPANETEPGKFSSPGCLHSVTMDQLLPDTRYWYRVGLEARGEQGVLEWSDTHEFTSAPIAATATRDGQGDDAFKPFAFLAYGDQGCPATGWTVGGEWIARMVEAELSHNNVTSARPPVRMVHHIGDLSYAEGAAHIWDDWQHMIQPITTRVPYMVGVGNHEYDHLGGGLNKDPSGVTTADGFHPTWGNFGNDSGGECGIPTAKRFTMPKSANSNGVFWYSYDFANLHTIMLSSEHDLSNGSPQHTWLQNDLRSVNRTVTPWLIVEMHRPLYNPETLWEQNAVGIGMRYEVEDLLKEYKVDLVLAGHYHSYFRSCDGLYREQCHQGGPTHLTIGSAGARLDEAMLYTNTWTAKSIQHQYGYSRITIMSDTSLHFEFVKVGDDTDETSGDVGDELWLHRDR